MKNIFLFIYFIFISIGFSVAQNTFLKSYSAGYACWGTQVIEAFDSGLVMTGYVHNQAGNPDDIYVLKTNYNGDTIWTKLLDFIDAKCYSISQTSDSGFILSGSLFDSLYQNVAYLLKINSGGSTIWMKCFFINYNAKGFSALQTLDGGYLLAGEFDTTGGAGRSFFIKTDSVGNVQWKKKIICGQINTANKVLQNPDGSLIFYGSYQAGVYCMKMDTAGSLIWAKVYATGNPPGNINLGLQATFDGGYLMSANFFVLKIDWSGNLSWSKSYDVQLSSPFQTLDSGFLYVADRMGILKTDSSGNIVFAKRYCDIGAYPELASVNQAVDGSIFIFGGIFPFVNSGYFYLIKTDPNGGNCYENNMTVNISTVIIQSTIPQVIDVTPVVYEFNPYLNESHYSNVYIDCASVNAEIILDDTDELQAFFTSNNLLTLKFELIKGELLDFVFCDLTGRIIYQSQLTAIPGTNKKEIPVGELAKGIYIVTLSGIDGSESVKVVK